jgi:hypothetical protein
MSANPAHDQGDAERWRRLEAEAGLIALTMADADRQRVMFLIARGIRFLPSAQSCARLQKND